MAIKIKTDVLHVRLPKAVLKEIDRQAKSVGMTRGTFMRSVLTQLFTRSGG